MLSVLTLKIKKGKKRKEGMEGGGRKRRNKFIKIDEITNIEKKAE